MAATPEVDTDVLLAYAELIGLAGATQLDIGSLNEETDPKYATDGPCWYARARCRDELVAAEDHAHPNDAVEALARRLAVGKKCTCGDVVALSVLGEETPEVGRCLWIREGQHWKRGCE